MSSEIEANFQLIFFYCCEFSVFFIVYVIVNISNYWKTFWFEYISFRIEKANGYINYQHIMLKQYSSSSNYGQSNRQPNRFLKQIPIFQRRQRSNSTNNCVIEKKRGFKPSDCFDPVKKDFLLQLSRKFWCKSVRKKHNQTTVNEFPSKNSYRSIKAFILYRITLYNIWMKSFFNETKILVKWKLYWIDEFSLIYF